MDSFLFTRADVNDTATDRTLKNKEKSSVFWDITPCGPLKVSLHSGGSNMLSCRFLARLILQP
jgi:hypothetical protein